MKSLIEYRPCDTQGLLLLVLSGQHTVAGMLRKKNQAITLIALLN